MTSIQVNLPDAAAEFVQSEIASGQYSTVSEYVEFLVEQARAARAKQALDEMLEAGLNSGTPIPFSTEWWSQRKAQLLATLPAETSE